MTLNHCFNFRNLILAAAFSAGLGFGPNASAEPTERSYLIDLNSKTVTDLGNVEATAINDAGQVVGRFRTAEGTTHAFITGPDGVGMRDLGTLGGNSSTARGINNSGQVTGWSQMASGNIRGFITGPDGANMRDLAEGGGTGINNAGQVAGWGPTSEGAQHAYITGDNGEASFIRWLDNSNPLSIFKTGVTAL